nr:integrase, catalytic region, zinc finger, CCHC-type, peptidase aspartic, catalytic [Tanacetum cinerariifolium]
MVADLRYFNSLELEIDSLRSQLETQKTQFLNEIDRLSGEYYYAGHMNAILGMYTELDEDLKAQLQNKGIVISELNKLIEKLKGKSVNTKFEKSSVIRQPNAFKSQRPSILGKPTTFSNSLERNDFSKSKPQIKSNPMGDRVMHNNSQRKKQDVEDHRRNVKFSKTKTSVTACNDSLKAKTLNVNFVCATCGKCVLKEKHDMCVLKSVSDVNSRTKMPIVMPLLEIILFIVDFRCSKHMTGNLKLLINFVEKFLGTVKFGNDQIAHILGYGDL